MLFNSYLFWAFFAVVLIAYRSVGHRAQNRILLAASLIFYGAWDWRFLILLLLTTVVDYYVGLGIARARERRERVAAEMASAQAGGGGGGIAVAEGPGVPELSYETAAPSRSAERLWLTLSVVLNMGLLGFFKYYGFFATELMGLLHTVGIPASLPVLKVVLPVGISFYTFQEMSYTIDVYRNRTPAVRSLADFALYVSFFPQLVAGPIERSDNLIPQILRPRPRRRDDFSIGLYFVLTGMFRKVVIADNMASIADGVFGAPAGQLNGLECLLGLYAFALQIYGDFSGYSAIAQGIARWMGFDLMVNFRMPYLAVSPSDFWRRWHISLSTWLRDYLYIPLGGNRGSAARTYRNLMLTMLLGGLWHGANWTFIAWGAFHGLLLCLYRPFETRRKPDADGPRGGFGLWIGKLLAGLLMFQFVCFGWLLFRAETMGQVGHMLRQMFTASYRPTDFSRFAIVMMAFVTGPFLIYEYWVERKGDLLAITKSNWLARGLFYAYLLLMLKIFPSEVSHAFIYFQF